MESGSYNITLYKPMDTVTTEYRAITIKITSMRLQTNKRYSVMYSHSVRQSVNALGLDKVFSLCYSFGASKNLFLGV